MSHLLDAGTPFVGILYAGLMICQRSCALKCLEFNCRFGDPETQALLPLLDEECDLAEIMMACVNGHLDSVKVSFKPSTYSACVVAASGGYPGAFETNLPISFQTPPFDALKRDGGPAVVQGESLSHQNLSPLPDAFLFHAATKTHPQDPSLLMTNGGRVLGVVGVAETLVKALKNSYTLLAAIHFPSIHYRRDIGHRALKFLENPPALVENLQSSVDSLELGKIATKSRDGKITYADAGVSIDRGNRLVSQIKSKVASTKRKGTDAAIGGFGGCFDLKAAGFVDPILVSGADGVGTKLIIAQMLNVHTTVGIDLVAMNVNDVLTQGAEPLFFLDYFACGKLEVDVAAQVIQGVVTGCLEAGCALVGGETAEMPGIYKPGEYDVAGFVVGGVERCQLLPRLQSIEAGDCVLALASSGIHSNGFTLVRKVLESLAVDGNVEALLNAPCPFETRNVSHRTLGQSLLVPTSLYVRSIVPLLRAQLIKSMAHITGGGLIENIPRVLPSHLQVRIDSRAWPFPSVFKWLMKGANLSVGSC